MSDWMMTTPRPERSVTGKRIALGVSGSIAAYKAAELSRRFVKRGIDVQAVFSRSATNFIGPATFSGITGHAPVLDLSGSGFTHLDVTRGLDALVIAPATANIIAKLAAGIADCAISTIVSAAECPVIVCPAMNESMWFSLANQRNVETLRGLGYELIGPGKGDLACGDAGWGRLADIEEIEEAVVVRLQGAESFAGRRFVVTAGPTREYLDPVRFLSNPASGKTGYAVADELARRGGETILISGPTHLRPNGMVRFIPVETAEQMRASVKQYFNDADALVMTAAVSDHKFSETAPTKIEKDALPRSLSLERNPDILAEIGATKTDAQVLIGFAAQTEDLAAAGRRKLAAKNLDLIVCTKVGFGEGFATDDIEALFVQGEEERKLGRISKRALAGEIADELEILLS